MTEAYAIKGPDGNIDLVLIDTDIEETWYEYIKSVEGRVPTSGSIVKDIQYWKDEGFTCVPVTVSEKGEAEALLREAGALLNRYRKETPLGNQPHMIAEQAVDSIQRIDAYLSRGQG